MQLSYIDIILSIPLLWGLYKGFTKGLIIEAASMVALGLAIWGGIKFHNYVSDWMQHTMHWDSKYLPILSFALLFIGVVLAVFGIAKIIDRIVKAVSLGFLNKLGGALFGMLKFGLILSMIIFFLEAINKSIAIIPQEAKNKSVLYPWVEKIAPTIIPALHSSKLKFPDNIFEDK